MKVLYVTASCLDKNTSANMSHNAYIQGLIENGAEVDIIMASNSWGEYDSKMSRFQEANYYIYNSRSFKDWTREFVKRMLKYSKESNPQNDFSNDSSQIGSIEKMNIRLLLRRLYLLVFRQDPIYPLHHKWLKRAQRFKNDTQYDLVISNSSPEASHKLVLILTDKNRIQFKRWVQIWEDPWYYDIYGVSSTLILDEEREILKRAQEVFYVSPLTLHYQKLYFPESSQKMRVIPLPYFSFQKEEQSDTNSEFSFGYFGDYYSYVRDIEPFYDALKSSGYKGYIYGDSDLKLESDSLIKVSPRVTLSELEKIQQRCAVLVHLCNLRGGQIPGKIYHYSATNKPIIFILDGTDEEQNIIKDYFTSFSRYVFCHNEKESIISAMQLIEDNYKSHSYSPVELFSPRIVCRQLFNGCQ